MSASPKSSFRNTVWRYWRRHGRHALPWRKNLTPYRTLISEVMLQQTQVSRVSETFRLFIRTFPSFRSLASARPAAVLAIWQGLGYNRRALLLHRCAQIVVAHYRGALPSDSKVLQCLPGIGPYTAAAVAVFAFNVPQPLIETNIRRVYLHHFFQNQQDVSDADILPFVARDMRAVRSPRAWGAALMDYGAWLAHQYPNPNRRSRHYVRQSRFEGSARQLRGQLLRTLLERSHSRATLMRAVDNDQRVPTVLASLQREGFIIRRGDMYRCA